MRTFSALAIACFLGGCAMIEDQIPVRYNAPANISVAPGAGQVVVQVTSSDGRVSNRDRVATKKNGYGMEMAKIVASNDVVQEIGNAVQVELSSLGFRAGPGGLAVNVEVNQFYSDFKTGFWSGDAVAEVAFQLTAKKPDGTFIYGKSYKALGMNPGVMLMEGAAAQKPLTDALREAVQLVARDTDLHQALVKAGTPAAPAPEPMPATKAKRATS